MKFFAVFAAIVAVSAAYAPIAVWNLEEITDALRDPATNPAHVPYLVDGLNQIMSSLYAGEQESSVVISFPVTESMSLDELSAAINNPATNPAVLPYLEDALNNLMVAIYNGQHQDTINFDIPAMEVNIWDIEQLSAAVQSPETDPELLIYLEFALNQLMEQIFSGTQVSQIAVITPPGVIVTAPAVNPAPGHDEPAIPEPIIITPVAPVVDESAASVVTPGAVPESEDNVTANPLVQIIVNVGTRVPAAPVKPLRTPTPVLEHVPSYPISPQGPIIAVGPWA